MPTITFNNHSSITAIVVLDPEFGESLIPTTVPKYFSTISFSNFTKNISEDDIVVNDYKIGVVVPPGNSSFEFTPFASIPIPDVIIRGAGDCSVTYVDGATTINVTPDELNRFGDGSSSLTNPFCFEFDGADGALSTTQNIFNRVYNFNNAISISCWVTFGDDMFTKTGNKNFIIVDQAGPSSNANFSKGYCLYVTRTPGNAKLLRFQVGTINTPSTGPSPASEQRAQINITNLRTASNQVFFILATYDSSGNGDIQLYLKSTGISRYNQQVPIHDGPLDYNNQTNRFCIGNTEPNGNQGFDGKIDEVGIFEKALSSADADNLFNWNANGNLLSYNNDNNSELRGWYRMGENANFSNPGGVGDWTLKSATDLLNTNLNLTSINIAETDVKEPGLAGQIQPPLPPPYNNQFSFFFDNENKPVGDKQFFTRPDTPALNLTNDFTLSIWAKVLIADPPDDGKLFDNATTTNGFVLYHDDVGSGEWNWEIRNSTGPSGANGRIIRVRSGFSPTSNTWTHLVGTFKNGVGTLYVDGVNVASQTFAAPGQIAGVGSSAVRIGASTGTSPTGINAVTGSLNNCSLWNVAFNQAEVNELYDNGPQDLNDHTRADNGVAWWQLGGNDDNLSFDAPSSTWTMGNSFTGASSVSANMTSENMVLASKVADTP